MAIRILDVIKRLRKNGGVQCPCCGWEGSEILPFGSKKRKNAQCPQCLALERHRLFFLFLRSYLPTEQAVRVLHFAPEPSLAGLFRELKNIDYLSVDIASGKAMVVEDIGNLSFGDNGFDYIFCSHVLEHIPDEVRALRELHRVLKPGGTALISVPLYHQDRTYENPDITTPQERKRHFGQPNHVRKYGRDFAERLKIVFPGVTELRYFCSLPAADIQKYGLKDHKLFLCGK